MQPFELGTLGEPTSRRARFLVSRIDPTSGRGAVVDCLLLMTLLVLGATGLPSAMAAQASGDSTKVAARADESDEERPEATIDDQIVVSASHIPLPLTGVGSSVTILDREEIERSHATSVLELLRRVPGLSVVRTGGPGKATSVFVRGGNSSHTLVLIDGVRVNDDTTGAFDFADLTTDHIERIEVLRGPQSTLYGSEAVAGVVSIVSRRGEGPARFTGGVEVGSEDHQRFRVGVEGSQGRFDYSLSAANVRTDGVSSASEEAGNSETDPWENTTVGARLGTAFLGDGRADLAVRLTDGDTEIDGFTFGVGPTDDLNTLQKREQTSAALTLTKPLSSIWTQTVFVGYTEDNLRGEDPDPEDFFSNYEIDGTTTQLMLQSELRLTESNTLTLGARQEDREANNVGSFDESVDIRSFFAEHLWASSDGRVNLSLGLRNDDHSVFGDETTYRFTASAQLTSSSRLHGSYGTGFKAPTFSDLFFPGFGNPNLVPETSRGFDLGYEGSWGEGRWGVDLTLFSLEFEDLILFTFPAGFVNVAEAESSGFELEARFDPKTWLRVRASHTYTESEDLATGLPLARRPEHRTALHFDVAASERWQGTLSALAVRNSIDADGSEMDDYERLDASLEFRSNPWLQPYLRIENLLDQDYQELPGYTTPGLTAIVGIDLALR